MKDVLHIEKGQYAVRNKVDITMVPTYKVRTPLQKAIQLMKRHRDIFFQHNDEDAPISIIITTLAALAYNGEANVYEALCNIVEKMPQFVKMRNGKYWIENPVMSAENFADKWNEKPTKATAFYHWLGQVRQDLLTAPLACYGQDSLANHYKQVLGKLPVERAVTALGRNTRTDRRNDNLYINGLTGAMVPTLYMNNEISYEHDFNRKMEKICRALANALDTDAVAALEASKTQVFKDLLQYQQTSNVIDVPKQMATEILGDINPIMRANCYPETVHIIGNAGVDSLIRKLAQHGIYNDVNKRMEYDNKIIHYTNNVLNGTGKNGTFFAVADGMVGVLTRVDREALRRASANFHEWDVVRLPYIDLPVGSHYYTAVGDQSAIAGAASADMVCNVKEYFGFSVDVAYIIAYNSDPTTVANPIIKAQIDAPATNQPYATPVYITNAADFPSGH